jgi:hypothetical protein
MNVMKSNRIKPDYSGWETKWGFHQYFFSENMFVRYPTMHWQMRAHLSDKSAAMHAGAYQPPQNTCCYLENTQKGWNQNILRSWSSSVFFNLENFRLAHAQ